MLSLIAAICSAPLMIPTVSAYRTAPDTLLWGGYLSIPGPLHVEVAGRRAKDLRLTMMGGSRASMGAEGDAYVRSAGWYRFELRGDLEGVTGLELSGEATRDAKFNTKERRNAASVHLWWPEGDNMNGEWFYNELRGVTDPIHTYYMACGFNRGYFGMQVNSPTERRVIFSIWDSGSEAVDRDKVSAENRVQLLAKGKDVRASDFGNEGTGGHSHLVYNWKTGQTQRFLVHAVPEGNTTVYTGYFKPSDRQEWMLIASFRAPKDGHRLGGLYSFIEDFSGVYGYRVRKAQFGPAWLRTSEGQWLPLQEGRFGHDGTGGTDRFDYDFKARGGGFEMQNGGFEGSSPVKGTKIRQTYRTPAPAIPFEDLPMAY